MLSYRKDTWSEGTHATGKHTELLFSRSESFRLLDAPQKRLEVSVAAFSTSSTSLLQVLSSGHEIAVTDEGSMTIMLPFRGDLEVSEGRRTYFTVAGGLLVFGPSKRRTLVLPSYTGSFEARMMKVPITSRALADAREDQPSTVDDDPHIPVDQAAGRVFSDLLQYIFADLVSPEPRLVFSRPASLAEALLDEHLRQLISRPVKDARAVHPSPRIIAAAEEYMRAHFDSPLRVSEVAAALGVGARQLQSAFHKNLLASPWELLTSIRLEEVRSRLLASGTEVTVTEIAMNCGFTHLGRFSQRYKSTYGELPSATLRRARSN